MELLAELDQHDVPFDVVPGADTDLSTAVAALKTYGKRALYVVCVDGDLDAPIAWRLRNHLLRTSTLSEQHVVTLNVTEGSVARDAITQSNRANRLRRRATLARFVPTSTAPDPTAPEELGVSEAEERAGDRAPVVAVDAENTPRRTTSWLAVSALALACTLLGSVAGWSYAMRTPLMAEELPAALEASPPRRPYLALSIPNAEAPKRETGGIAPGRLRAARQHRLSTLERLVRERKALRVGPLFVALGYRARAAMLLRPTRLGSMRARIWTEAKCRGCRCPASCCAFCAGETRVDLGTSAV